MKYKNLRIIGSSHIAKQSIDEVKEAVETDKPDIVAIELDKNRLYGLMNSKKTTRLSLRDIRSIGIKGYIFSLIGAWASKKLGSYVGVTPGSEMKQAVRLARKNNIKLALIDRNIEKTLKRFSKALSWKEKWNFLVDILKAVILRKNELEFDLNKVPADKIINKLIGQVKGRYPNVYKVLIAERNKIMAARLQKLMDEHPDKKILAIMGAGHVQEVLRMLKDNKITYTYSVG